MKMRVQTRDDPRYPFRDVENHVPLTLVDIKWLTNRAIEYLVTRMERGTQELHIEIEVRQQKHEDTQDE